MKCERPDPKDKKAEAYRDDMPVTRMRPDKSEESIMTPPSPEEIQESLEEMNPDENSMESRG